MSQSLERTQNKTTSRSESSSDYTNADYRLLEHLNSAMDAYRLPALGSGKSSAARTNSQSEPNPSDRKSVPAAVPDIHDPKFFVSALTGANFAHMDAGKKGYLTRTDLSKYIKDTNNSQETRAAASELFDHYDDARKFLNSFDSKSTGYTMTAQIVYASIFKEDHSKVDGISEKSIKTIGAMFDKRSEKINEYGARAGQILEDGIYTWGNGAVAASLGTAAIADPEPLTKTGLAIGTVVLAGVAIHSIHDAIANPVSSSLRAEYEKRQKMLESWNYFDRPGKSN